MSATGPARASANSAPRWPRLRPPQVLPRPRVRSTQPQAPPHTITGPGPGRELASPGPLQVPPRPSSQHAVEAPPLTQFLSTWLQAPPLSAADSALLRLSLLHKPCLKTVPGDNHGARKSEDGALGAQ